MNKMYIDPQHAALVLVDVQNDYCHENGLKAQQGADVSRFQNTVSVIEKLVEQARKLDIPVVFIKNINSEEHLSEAWINRPGGMARSAVTRKGTWGAEIYRLVPQANDVVIEKSRFSAFINTNLDEILRELNRTALIFTGFATNVCVESSARDGFMMDYHVTLVKDACAGYVPELEEATHKNIAAHFGAVVDSSEILQMWAQEEPVK